MEPGEKRGPVQQPVGGIEPAVLEDEHGAVAHRQIPPGVILHMPVELRHAPVLEHHHGGRGQGEDDRGDHRQLDVVLHRLCGGGADPRKGGRRRFASA